MILEDESLEVANKRREEFNFIPQKIYIQEHTQTYPSHSSTIVGSSTGKRKIMKLLACLGISLHLTAHDVDDACSAVFYCVN